MSRAVPAPGAAGGAEFHFVQRLDVSFLRWWRVKRPPPTHHISNHWVLRMYTGWLCRRRLNRQDVSPLVHALFDHGEKYAALAACEQVQQEQPQNLHAYIHGIDLALRCHRNVRRALRSLNRGQATLKNSHERDLLECFHLYATSIMGRL